MSVVRRRARRRGLVVGAAVGSHRAGQKESSQSQENQKNKGKK
jgi:hypothetical protein